MQRWSGRVAMVTGASSGIGAAIAKDLVQHGMLTIGVARRLDRMQELAEELKGGPGKFYPIKGDVSKEEDILAAFKWAKDNVGGVDVLINNAAVLGEMPFSGVPTHVWRSQLEVNVLGLSVCTREAVKGMRERGVDDGHIVQIGSILGHVLAPGSDLTMYVATKHAVRVLAEGLRRDLAASKSNIRVSCVSPGLVNTEMVDRSPLLDINKLPFLEAEDIARAVLFALAQPPNVQIHDIIIKPIGEMV